MIQQGSISDRVVVKIGLGARLDQGPREVSVEVAVRVRLGDVIVIQIEEINPIFRNSVVSKILAAVRLRRGGDR